MTTCSAWTNPLVQCVQNCKSPVACYSARVTGGTVERTADSDVPESSDTTSPHQRCGLHPTLIDEPYGLHGLANSSSEYANYEDRDLAPRNGRAVPRCPRVEASKALDRRAQLSDARRCVALAPTASTITSYSSSRWSTTEAPSARAVLRRASERLRASHLRPRCARDDRGHETNRASSDNPDV